MPLASGALQWLQVHGAHYSLHCRAVAHVPCAGETEESLDRAEEMVRKLLDPEVGLHSRIL